ncbi:MAG: PilC/PilY family type IV pilus protein [Woeseiaceae bacterium]|nr:PilC/PilY family type IV pilus protein [Woeseiaceae bacterium]
MFRSRKHFAWAIAGALLTITAGSPALADDVELLLSTPGSSNAAKPNILFIIDSSGSMKTVETSQEPYDSSEVYPGPCDSDMLYWTTNSGIPKCGAEYKFRKSSFVCAQGWSQLGSGSYTDTMAMYRKRKGNWKWRTISRSQVDKAVECRADSGVHGYGGDPEDEPYARSGNNDPYTSDPNLEVDWGSSPTHRIYTVYDSNYLNWYYNPPGTSMSRTDIVKAVTKNVLGSVKDVNVGFMRFNWDQGGPVIHAIKDLDSNRTEADAIVDGIPAAGYTPLAETMYEAALYYRGMPAKYGGVGLTDSDALISSAPMLYKQPAEYACAKNFVVLLTDGAPTRDTDVYFDAPNLPGFKTGLGRTSCTGGNVNGACLDDISEYMSKVDINPNVPGDQFVTTYTIGFTVDLPLLKATAEKSGGEYYLASDVTSLTKALTDIVTDIFDRDISFTAPAVAVNAFNRTQHLNDLYVSVFRASDEVHWPGNMKKFTIKDSAVRDSLDNDAIDPDTGYFADSARNFWSQVATSDGADVTKAGAANELPDPSVRNVYTNVVGGALTLPQNELSVGNKDAFADEDLGLKGAEGEPEKEDLIDWARGVDVKDQDNDPDTDVRYSMGDTLHSQPASVVYGNTSGGYDIVVFNATNDGYLHAIDASTGREIWSFIPYELLDNLTDLYFNENVDFKTYGIDGDVVPIVYDKNDDGVIELGTDFVYIVFGMRRGGDNYYMLDVTDRYAPTLKWIRTFPEFGQSWSTPSVAKVTINTVDQDSPQDAVLILGGGYDTSHDAPAHPTGTDVEGAGIFMLDVETGNMLWRAGPDSGAETRVKKMKRSIPSQVRVVDMNGDGLADRMYAADLGGQLFRFDIYNGQDPDNLVTGGVIARLGAEGLSNPSPWDTRRFYTTPDVAMFTDKREDRRYLAINIGSGYRAHPLDNSAGDKFFSVRDPNVFSKLTQGQYNGYDIIKPDDLVEVQGSAQTIVPATSDGWQMTLPPTQKVLSTARTFNDAVYFVTFEPTVNSSDPCQAGLSLNRLYRVNVANGDPVIPFGEAVPEDGAAADDARITRLEQGGIAPQPVFLFPSPWDPDCEGEECTPPPLACVGVECFDPDFPNNPVRTLWTQDGID